MIEQLGRAVAPGPFVPTVIASAVLAAVGGDAGEGPCARAGRRFDDRRGRAWGVPRPSSSRTARRRATPATCSAAALANVILVAGGDDVAVVDVGEAGATVTVDVPPNMDPTRRTARVTLDGAPATVLPGARRVLVDLARVLLSAEAVGLARECTEMAAAYAKERLQFGRPIAMFQAVKHHCANMAVATELATSAVWDAAKAASTGGDQLTYAAAVAATLAGPAADLCANLNTQVHGGIAITWEHDAHLFMRRATVLLGYLDPEAAAIDLTDLVRRGVTRAKTVELPPEAEAIRDEVRAFADSDQGPVGRGAARPSSSRPGYVMPHWPEPYGREAGAVEQLVIEQEFAAAGISRPAYGITGWVILTLIQYGDRRPGRALGASRRSTRTSSGASSSPSPTPGSDAAGIKTKATRVDGGWLVNGQKVWTSGAHVAGMGFATVRTNPDVPKHEGITTMVIDMHAEGVEVRPLKMTSGDSEFNEVFFNDVFVPDDDVVGPGRRRLDGRPRDARQREREHRRRPGRHVDARLGAAHPVRRSIPSGSPGGAARIGRYIARAPGDGPAEPAQRAPGRRRRRARAPRAR